MLRSIRCVWCANTSSNQFGTTPFDDMAQSQRYPSLMIHLVCAVDLSKALMDEFQLSADSPIVSELYSAHDHSRF